jgi:hypothetical protein
MNMQELNALKALKDPSHSRTSRWSIELVRQGLLRLGEAGAHPMFGQTIDQQAQHHDQSERNDALRLFDEDRGGQKQRIFQEAKAAFDAALPFIRAHEFLIRKDGWVQDIGGDDEARFAPRFLLDLSLVDAERCLDVPLHCGRGFFAWASTTHMML